MGGLLAAASTCCISVMQHKVLLDSYTRLQATWWRPSARRGSEFEPAAGCDCLWTCLASPTCALAVESSSVTALADTCTALSS